MSRNGCRAAILCWLVGVCWLCAGVAALAWTLAGGGK